MKINIFFVSSEIQMTVLRNKCFLGYFFFFLVSSFIFWCRVFRDLPKEFDFHICLLMRQNDETNAVKQKTFCYEASDITMN